MNTVDVSCPTIHSLYELYKNLDKLDLSPLINDSIYYSYPIVKTESLNIDYTVSNNKRYLELKKNYLELYKFKIPLGLTSNLINKRVRNELMARLHKVLNNTDKTNIVNYIHFIFKKRIKMVFSDIFLAMNKNVAVKIFKKKVRCKLSDYFLSFCSQFNLDCTIEVTRSLIGRYTIKLMGKFTPFYNFIKTFKMTVKGNRENIVEKFHCILNKKIFIV